MEIHIGNRVADVTLVSKEGNKVRLSIDGKPYDVDIVMTDLRPAGHRLHEKAAAVPLPKGYWI